MPQPSPAPTTTPKPPSAGDFIHPLWNGFTSAVHQSPWTAVLVALLVIAGIARSARIALHTGPKDPVRLFPKADKRILLARAGHRCEYHTPFGTRCRATDKLEADHVHPHSRGGWTNLSNGQILCKAHNREKLAGVPFDRTLRRLAEHRVAYYPPDVDRVVVRRAPPPVRRRRHAA